MEGQETKVYSNDMEFINDFRRVEKETIDMIIEKRIQLAKMFVELDNLGDEITGIFESAPFGIDTLNDLRDDLNSLRGNVYECLSIGYRTNALKCKKTELISDARNGLV